MGASDSSKLLQITKQGDGLQCLSEPLLNGETKLPTLI